MPENHNYANPAKQHHTLPQRQSMRLLSAANQTRHEIAKQHIELDQLFTTILHAFSTSHLYDRALKLKHSARTQMHHLGSLYDSIVDETLDEASKWSDVFARYKDMIENTRTVNLLAQNDDGTFGEYEDKSRRQHGSRWIQDFRAANPENK